MNYQISEFDGAHYVECLPGGEQLQDETGALDLVAACGESGTPRLLIYGENLHPDFFDLSTGLAGKVLLKFTNYYLKVAAVLQPEQINRGKFSLVAQESRGSRDFRVFTDRDEAVTWLGREV